MGSKSFTNKVVGIFSDRNVVDSVLSDLNSSGFDKDDISVLARDLDSTSDRIVTHSTTTYPDTEIGDRRITSDFDRDVPTGSNIYPSGTMSGSMSTLDRSEFLDDYPTNLDRTDSMGNKISDVSSRIGDKLRGVDDTLTGRDVLHNNRVYDKDYDNDIVKEKKMSGERLTYDEDRKDFDDVHEVADRDPKAMVKGATAGGALGLIAGLAVLMIPGLGPVLAAGPLAAAITAAAGGAAIGATAGTLLGILKDEGIPSDRADFYNRHFNKGDVLVMVHTDEGRSSLAREILVRHNPETIDTF